MGLWYVHRQEVQGDTGIECKMKIDIKTIITIGGLLVPLVGFYYTTNMRLDALEAQVASVQKQVKQIKKTKKGKNKK